MDKLWVLCDLAGEARVRVLLLVSAFNGLSQRAWCALREAGHDVGVLLATSADDMVESVRAAPPRKSALYNGPVAEAALECIEEVLVKAADPAFQPVPTDTMPTEVPGTRMRPAMKQPDRTFE